jgi:peptidoglycan-N-acetylglucosamine deacetylase
VSAKRVTLTFDNGPTEGVTGRVLDILRAQELRATFFVCGKQLLTPAARELARRAVDEGHWVGNHTMTHDLPLGVDSSPGTLRREIGATQEMLAWNDGQERLFRPAGSGGALDRRLFSPPAVDYLTEHGYSVVLWNSVPRDWEAPDTWVEAALADVARQDWTVMVLHDLPTGAMDHLPAAIDAIREGGAQFEQSFPESCVPIVRGRLRAPVDHLMPDHLMPGSQATGG